MNTELKKDASAGCMERIVQPLRLTDGKRFTNPKGDWIEISWQHGNLVCYNQSGSCYWQGGSLQCTKTKFRKMLADGNYLPNAEPSYRDGEKE